MTISVPYPVAQWTEPPLSGAAVTLTALAPFKTPEGYWVLLRAAIATPAGYTRGAVTDAGAYVVLDASTTEGMRVTRAPSSAVLVY